MENGFREKNSVRTARPELTTPKIVGDCVNFARSQVIRKNSVDIKQKRANKANKEEQKEKEQNARKISQR